MQTLTGLDCLRRDQFRPLHGRSIGLVCNQATVARDYHHILDLILAEHHAGRLHLKAVFGPQHGLFGHTQDNMIEWESGDIPSREFALHSLYGAHREPTPEMLAGIDVLVIDLQDVGAKYYTFIWTMALCLKACEPLGIELLILDRPNPIDGTQTEGSITSAEFASFVGLYPLPIRHGMTIGEIAHYLQKNFFPRSKLMVERMQGWDRGLYHDETGVPWALPSPNMPTVDTAVVYPGGCLLEATNLSEGRGTTRPFEIFGAPFLHGQRFCDELNALKLHGAWFQAIQFEPTFQKHAKTLCEGAFLHVVDRKSFEPVLAYVAVLQCARRQAGDGFRWSSPPYEYEFVKMPIDILAGNTWVREAIDSLSPLGQIRERFRAESSAFEPERAHHMLY